MKALLIATIVYFLLVTVLIIFLIVYVPFTLDTLVVILLSTVLGYYSTYLLYDGYRNIKIADKYKEMDNVLNKLKN